MFNLIDIFASSSRLSSMESKRIFINVDNNMDNDHATSIFSFKKEY